VGIPRKGEQGFGSIGVKVSVAVRDRFLSPVERTDHHACVVETLKPRALAQGRLSSLDHDMVIKEVLSPASSICSFRQRAEVVPESRGLAKRFQFF
jgi:hypothetical protein